MDWNNPAARAALVEEIGIKAYNEVHRKHIEDTTIETVNGYGIRSATSGRWGTLFCVSGTTKAFSKFEQAKDFASKLPPKPEL